VKQLQLITDSLIRFCYAVNLTQPDYRKFYEYKVLRITSGSKREEVTGGWRRLHNEELRNWYTSPNTDTDNQGG